MPFRPLLLAPILLALSLPSCKSIGKLALSWRVRSLKETRAQKAAPSKPPAPYQEEFMASADRFWRSLEDSSSISYFSSCSQEDSSLEDMQEAALSSLLSYRILESRREKGALLSRFQSLRPSKSWHKIYIFKEGGCSFILSFAAPSKAVFQKNLPVFNSFAKDFHGSP